jgi:hypothetical protein
MRCKYVATGDVHKSGRLRLRCDRSGCESKGLMPLGGTPEQVDAKCNGIPFRHEWGHWLAIFLEANGLSKRAWANARAWLGFRGQCGCAKREAKLNTLGQYLYSLPSRIAQRLRRSCGPKGEG